MAPTWAQKCKLISFCFHFRSTQAIGDPVPVFVQTSGSHIFDYHDFQWLSPFLPVTRLKSSILVVAIGDPMNPM